MGSMPSANSLSPERSILLDGTSNFRDIGGYRGHGGRRVQWRKIFRSAHLGQLTAADLQKLDQMGLRRVIDFRGETERLAEPCALRGAQVHALSIEPTIVQALEAFAKEKRQIDVHQAQRLMQQTYHDFVTDNTPRFTQLFGHLLQDGTPLVFHCTAGKDRTGFAAALVLASLGVSREDILQDYLLTNQLYLPPLGVGEGALPEVRAAIQRVQADYLQASLDVIERGYGGLENYLEKALGIGPSQKKTLIDKYLDSSSSPASSRGLGIH